ncbi:VOC family protein [Subtercola endophyticus]|uniref:VOC family protein n=1 Tax=Subtercola endophyticus TaxID=2895559 RepID=UPI001E51771E|nr:VOC family protein [Subtercola endophyticus]UFS57461.1 VOC family protein [Subtercola endophyticus]
MSTPENGAHGTDESPTESRSATFRTPARVDYFEIGTPDPVAAQAFYGDLFGWQFDEPSEPAQYSMVNGGAGGLWNTEALGGASWAVFYVHVDDVAASFAQAVGIGATVALPVINNGQIEFAHLIDPAGNRFAIWNEAPAAG